MQTLQFSSRRLAESDCNQNLPRQLFKAGVFLSPPDSISNHLLAGARQLLVVSS